MAKKGGRAPAAPPPPGSATSNCIFEVVILRNVSHECYNRFPHTAHPFPQNRTQTQAQQTL